MIVVAIIGILAAVAIPAYQDYTAKAQVSEAFILLDGLKTPISEALSNDVTAGCAIPTGAVSTGKYVASINPTYTPPRCALLATFVSSGANAKLLNKTVTFTFDTSNGTWSCSTTLNQEITPKSC